MTNTLAWQRERFVRGKFVLTNFSRYGQSLLKPEDAAGEVPEGKLQTSKFKLQRSIKPQSPKGE
jgi:hypothetical protein